MAVTRRRFGSQAGGGRRQYVPIGQIDDELAGQNDRAPKGWAEKPIRCVEASSDMDVSAANFACRADLFDPNHGSRHERRHPLISALSHLDIIGLVAPGSRSREDENMDAIRPQKAFL